MDRKLVISPGIGTKNSTCKTLGRMTWLVAPLVLLVLGSSVSAQSASTQDDPRTMPAPWRPAFGPVTPPTNTNAVPAVDRNAQPTTTVNSGLNPAVNSEPSNPASLVQSQVAPPAQIPNPGETRTETSQPISPGNTAGRPEPTGQEIGGHVGSDDGPGVTRVTRRMEQLPNSAGQVWREYDISPYTSQIKSTEDPQQAILDWILRETGTEMWFNQPLGILHANRNQVYVYHTPEIQAVVKGIVDRFVRTRGQLQQVDVNLVTIENPNWRAESYTMLQPIEVRSAGVEAWMISKENAAILLSGLSRRVDFKPHSSGSLTNHDGQTFVLEKTRPVQFIRNLRWVPNQVPNYQPLLATINEGYSLSISCLSSLDNNTIEATIKCDVDQVEKLSNVKVNLPGINGVSQQMNLQIPQLVSWRLHERFRWPNDQVLLLSCGVVASPEPETSRIPLIGSPRTRRADALLFIEYRGPATGATMPRITSSTEDLAPIR